jgi:hypothetical protein
MINGFTSTTSSIHREHFPEYVLITYELCRVLLEKTSDRRRVLFRAAGRDTTRAPLKFGDTPAGKILVIPEPVPAQARTQTH